MNRSDRLYHIRYRVDPYRVHIKLNPDICSECETKPCLTICPVDNYTLEEGQVSVKWGDCLECGACRMVCPKPGLEWTYPDGNRGISYRFG